MLLGYAGHDRQPEAGPGTHPSRVGLPEAIEDVAEGIGIEARTVVADSAVLVSHSAT